MYVCIWSIGGYLKTMCDSSIQHYIGFFLEAMEKLLS